MISCQLDSRWDLTIPALFELLHRAATERLIDVIGGGPPCATTSRARHNPKGPRPLRGRSKDFWGFPDLSWAEFLRVSEANSFWLYTMSIMEAVAASGGAFWWEHPDDPGREPYPTIWLTAEMIGLLERTRATSARFHQ